MNRTDRLYALREELRRAGATGRTADRLAATFEVSTRTIKRDISSLQHSGFPIWTQPGPGGGYVVDPAATLPPVNFTDAEASGLAAAVTAHRGQPYAHHARAALVKMLNAMGPPVRERATALSNRIWIDLTDSPGEPQDLRAVERALHERRVLKMAYRDHDGSESTRRVDPVLLAHTQGTWYLVGHCRTHREMRWLRLDRISSAHVTAESAADIPVDAVGTPPATATAVTTAD